MNAPTITTTVTRRMEVSDSIKLIRSGIDDLYAIYDELKALDGVNPETLTDFDTSLSNLLSDIYILELINQANIKAVA